MRHRPWAGVWGPAGVTVLHSLFLWITQPESSSISLIWGMCEGREALVGAWQFIKSQRDPACGTMRPRIQARAPTPLLATHQGRFQISEGDSPQHSEFNIKQIRSNGSLEEGPHPPKEPSGALQV